MSSHVCFCCGNFSETGEIAGDSLEGLGQGDSHILHKLVQPVRASGKRDRHDVSSRDGQRGNVLWMCTKTGANVAGDRCSHVDQIRSGTASTPCTTGLN